ncbi:MAG: hypothetical protein SGPRY_011047 [Prymnesium sp.]
MIAPTSTLESIAAAPRSPIAFDVAEGLFACDPSSPSLPLPIGSWRHAFRNLITHPAFTHNGWAKAPFKLEERWEFAEGCYTMADVERDVSLLPAQFLAHGVRYEGGIYNKPLPEGFTYDDVAAAMEGATVVMLNAGFLVPKLARVSLAMLEASGLPIWLNVYLSRPGLVQSTQLHTDKQDVLLIQSTGRKRWRVYKPPPPAHAPLMDPFARGKGTDLISPRSEDLLIDTVLYVPAGFPHETDTLTSDSDSSDFSVHLTVGLDTHLWGLSFAKARELALRRAGRGGGLGDGAHPNSLPLREWSRLNTPLPLGFLAASRLQELCGDAPAPLLPPSLALQTLTEGMESELAQIMLEIEPTRWGSTEELRGELDLQGSCSALLSHYRLVLSTQKDVYMRAAHALSPPLAREGREAIEMLMAAMDRLDDSTASLERWADGDEQHVAARGVAAGGKSGFGGGKKKGGKKKKR